MSVIQFWSIKFIHSKYGTCRAFKGLPRWISGKESTCNAADEFDPWVRKIHWRRKWQPTPVFLSGKSHGQRTLLGHSPLGHRRVRHDLATKQQGLQSMKESSSFISQNPNHRMWRSFSMIKTQGRYLLLGLKSSEQKVMGSLISLEVSPYAGPGSSPPTQPLQNHDSVI